MELPYHEHGKDSNVHQNEHNDQHHDLIDFSVLTDAEVPTVPVSVSTLSSSFQNAMDLLTRTTMSQNQHRSLPVLGQQENNPVPVHLHHQHQTHDSILGQRTLQHQHQNVNQHSLASHDHLLHQTTRLAGPPQELQPSSHQNQTPQILEIVELAIDEGEEQHVQKEVVAITGTRSKTGRLPTLELEQCSICSTNYEKPRRIFPQPDVNRLLIKLLDITPSALANGSSFFSQYLPVCIDCVKKIKKYERLRNEMDVIKQDVVASLTDSLLYIQPKVGSALGCLKQPFLNRWVNSQRQRHHQSYSSPTKVNHITQKKITRVLPKDHYIKSSTSILQNSNQVKLGPWQLAGEVNIFTTDSSGNIADGQQYVTAYVTDVSSSNDNEYHERDLQLDPKTGMLVSKRKRRLSPCKSKANGNGGDENQVGVKKKQKQDVVEKAKQHERPPFFCESCGRVFSILKSLRCHVAECCKGPTKPDQCSICLADFSESTWLDLKFHIDLAHADECELDKCRHCRAEFLPNTIEDHECLFESSGSSKAIKPHQEYKCDFCDKIYFHTNSLGNHVRRHHKGEPMLTCEVCSRVFTTSAILKSHMSTHRTNPSGKNAHKCEICGIFCSTVWGLKQHKTVHSGERQYECENCGKKFRLFQAWKMHEVVHTRERKYSCQICGKLFAMYSTMQRHVKRHINPLPNLSRSGEVCQFCGDTRYFTKLSALKEHMIRKHPGTKEQFEICNRADGLIKHKDTTSSKSKSSNHTVKNSSRNEENDQNQDQDSNLDSEGDDEFGVLSIIKEEGGSDIEEIMEVRNSTTGHHQRVRSNSLDKAENTKPTNVSSGSRQKRNSLI